MVNEELIANIKARFQQGEKAEEIREALLAEGWMDGDLDAAFAAIRHEALMHVPIYARIHNWMESADRKTADLPQSTVIKIFAGIAFLFLAGVFLLYYITDPFGYRTSERDRQREDTAIALRKSLDQYYKDQRAYPEQLNQLVPKYMTAVPVDPKSNQPYAYKTIDNKANYEFCIDFELQALQCISSDLSSDIPVAEVQAPLPTQPIQYAVNGQIYIDADKDESKGDDEVGAEGVPIKVTNSELIVLCETTTDSSGIFNCNVPGEGQYSVEFTFPKGYGNPKGNPVHISLPSDSNLPNVETLFIGLVK